MAEKIITFNEDTWAEYLELRAWWKSSAQNSTRRPNPIDPTPMAAQAYIAKVVDTDLAGLTPGTGTGSSFDSPGVAFCDIYQVVDNQDGSAPLLRFATDHVQVYNVGFDSVQIGDWITVARDRYGSWVRTAGGGSSSAGSWVVAVAEVADEVSYTECGSGTITDSGNACAAKHYYAITQTYDGDCEEWNDGECVYLMDVEGRGLEIGVRYWSEVAGISPTSLTAASKPVDLPCTYDSSTLLYATDIGDVTRTVQVLEEIGKICAASGSATGAEVGQVVAGGADDSVLTLYRAKTVKWDYTACVYIDIESYVVVAEMHGCPLEINKYYEGFYEEMIPDVYLDNSAASGTGTSGPPRKCHPLYLVDHKKDPKTGVARISCDSGILHVYTYQPTDNCGTVAEVYAYSAGCCDCGSTLPGSSSSSSSECCGRTLNSTLMASVPGNGSITLTYDGSQYWTGSKPLACGLTLYLRFSQGGASDCLCGTLEYSCDGVNWVPTASAVGLCDTCGPPYESRPFDGIVFNATAGCAFPNFCASINGIVVSE